MSHFLIRWKVLLSVSNRIKVTRVWHWSVLEFIILNTIIVDQTNNICWWWSSFSQRRIESHWKLRAPFQLPKDSKIESAIISTQTIVNANYYFPEWAKTMVIWREKYTIILKYVYAINDIFIISHREHFEQINCRLHFTNII